MSKEFIDNLVTFMKEKKPKYHLVMMLPYGVSDRYKGEKLDSQYISDIADEILGNDYVLNAQILFTNIVDSLKVKPSGLIIPQGHADEDAIKNIQAMYGGQLPDIPIFHAMKNAGNYCNKDGSLRNPEAKELKDEWIKESYRNWLIKSIKPNVLDLSDL